MVSSIAFVLLGQLAQGKPQSRYEMGLRLKELDAAWMRVNETKKRAGAVTAVQAAVSSFFSGKTGEVCRSLDEATAVLSGTKNVLGAGLTLRFQPVVAEPGSQAALHSSWAYQTDSHLKVSLRCGADPIELNEDQDSIQTCDLERFGFGKESKDQDVEISIGVGAASRKVKLSIVKNFDARLKKALEATDPVASGLARLVNVAATGNSETDVPIAKILQLAEGLATGKTRLAEVKELHTCTHGDTTFRIKFPDKLGVKPTLVVAMHGAGGSENLFFEGYGAGKSVELAMKRGWVFAAPRSSSTSVKDIVAWMKKVRGVEVGRVFVIGHSMGGMQAINTLKGDPKPAALGLFAPAAALPAKSAEVVPIFLAVGDLEMQMLRGMAARSGSQLGPLGQYRLYPNCEHLMVVAEAIEDCYRFLDKVTR